MDCKERWSKSKTFSRNKVIDCHCHFDMMDSPEDFIKRMEKEGHTIIGMTNRPCYFEQGIRHINPHGKIRLALGLHPLELGHAEDDLRDFAACVDKTSYIGEIGLDFSSEGRDKADLQIACFEDILRILSDKSKILSIHTRQAEREALDLLDSFYQENVIFHWYTGNSGLIPEIVDHGYYFSINEAMVCSARGRDLISKIPKDRVLTESDAPYNTRTDIRRAIEELARMWYMSSHDVEVVIENNFKTLLNSLKKRN